MGGTKGNNPTVAPAARRIPIQPCSANADPLLEHIPLALVTTDASLRITRWNSAAERVFGFRCDEMLGNDIRVLFTADMPLSIDDNGRYTFDNVTRNGLRLKCVWHVAPLADEAGLSALIEDVTGRVPDDAQIRHQRNLYRALTETNQIIARANGPAELFTEVCRVAVTYAGFKLAWIGELDRETLWVHPVASFGPAMDYLRHIRVSGDATRIEGQGPCGTAINKGRFCVENDFVAAVESKPWHLAVLSSGLLSAASFPILRQGETLAVLNVYSDECDFFAPSLIQLLQDMAKDISFALDNFDRETQRKQAEADRDLLIDILEATPDFVGVADPQGNVTYHNAGAHKLLGREVPDLETPWHVEKSHPAWAVELVRQEGFPTTLREGVWQGETAILHADGTETPVSQIIIAHRDEQGTVKYLSTIARDISERKQAEARIRQLAHYDPLTGLPNRTLLHDRLKRGMARARRHQAIGAVLFLDLDRFKTINDSLGHPTGDALLVQVAGRLAAQIRAGDSVARVGGDEFVIVLTESRCSREKAIATAQNVAEKIQTALAHPFNIFGHELHVTTSIGIALFPDEGDTVDNVLKHADTAMYRAKAVGRDAIQFFLPTMQEAAQARLKLEKDLRRALKRGQFTLYFQPQFNVETGQITGAEALLRWPHAERGLIPPAEFIPVAEETTFILPLGQWVLVNAVQHLKRWIDAGIWSSDQTLAINVSPRQFKQPNFVQQVSEILSHAEVAPECIRIEITEGLLVDDTPDTIEKIKALKAMGIGVAIDDFGTGYSSLVYLKRLPLDTLKIDKSFIRDIPFDANDVAIAETIIAMARHLGLQVIAEGVETQTQLEFLRGRGCKTGQGFYFSEPLAADAFATLIGSS